MAKEGIDKNKESDLTKTPKVNTKERPASIREQLKKLLNSGGKLTIDAQQVVQINEDGSVVINVATETQIAMKLSNWALSKKGTDSLKALQMIMEQVDGKPTHTIEAVTQHKFTPRAVREQRINELLEKRNNADQ